MLLIDRREKDPSMKKINCRGVLALTVSLLVIFAHLVTAAPFLSPLAGAASSIDFRLRTTEGGEITSEMLRGDVVVLAFGASWLPLSRTQVQGVQELADKYRDGNLRVYWVSTDSESPKSKNYATDAQLRDFAKKHGLKIAVLRDPEGALFKQTGADQLPAVIILDRQGNISGQPIGGLDPKGKLIDQLAPRLDSMLSSGN